MISRPEFYRPFVFAVAGILLGVSAFSSVLAQGWMHYGGDEGGTRFSSLSQIDRNTVQDLELAWSYRTGAVAENSKLRMFIDFQATPILLSEEAGGHRDYVATLMSANEALQAEATLEAMRTHLPPPLE